jgi:hypothetical protein
MDDDFLKMMEEELARHADNVNRTSVDDFDNLSPADMHNLLNGLLSDNCAVQYQPAIKAEVLAKVPFYSLFRAYLSRIDAAKEMKLTAKGNLPRKLCLELYGLGLVKEYYIESGLYKLNKEEDSIALQNLKIIGELAGLTKKRNNKLSLTKKGKTSLEEGKAFNLFQAVFTTNFSKFNLGYHDLYESEGMQSLFGYTLYLLLRYGKEKRPLAFYVDKNLKAFPTILEEFSDEDYSTPDRQYGNCFHSRFIDRFLKFYGFVEVDYANSTRLYDEEMAIKANDLFFQVFRIDNSKFVFKKAGYDA